MKKRRIDFQQAKRNFQRETQYMVPTLIGFIVIVLFRNVAGIILGATLAGFSGVIIIRKREMPSAWVVVRGTPAVIGGYLYIILMWGGAFFVLLAYLFKW